MLGMTEASTTRNPCSPCTFNSSLTDTTFVSLDAQPILDYFDNRPGEKWLEERSGASADAPRTWGEAYDGDGELVEVGAGRE